MKNKGFTLIELLVVVAIIGILAAVGVVSFGGFTESAKENLEAYKSSGHLELIEGAFQLTAQGRLIADRLVREALA